MPLDPSQELHLQETDLDDAGKAALRELSKWVNEEAIFVATGEIAKVQDDGLKTRCEPFFKAICQQLRENYSAPKFNVIRITSNQPITLNTSNADLVPLRIKGNPTVAGKPFVLGKMIHVRETVQVSAELDLLFFIPS